MPSNAETVKSIYRTFGEGDLAGVLAHFGPGVEWVTPETLPWSRGRYRGAGEVEEYFAAFLEHLEEPAVEYEELVEAGELVLAIGYERGRARATGLPFSARFMHLWRLRDGRVVRMEGVADTAAVTAAFAGESRAQPAA